MKLIQNVIKAFQIPLLVASCVVLTACANGGVFHGFGFNMREDNQDADVLNYRYGTARRSIAPEEFELKKGRPFYSQSMGGEMPRPDFLYVKWKSSSTGQIFEDNVDLRTRLPKNFEGQWVYFMIHGPQLYVYLISNDPRPDSWEPIGPSTAQGKKTLQIYPDSSKK